MMSLICKRSRTVKFMRLVVGVIFIWIIPMAACNFPSRVNEPGTNAYDTWSLSQTMAAIPHDSQVGTESAAPTMVTSIVETSSPKVNVTDTPPG